MSVRNRVMIVGILIGLLWSSSLCALTLTNDEAYQLLSLQTQLFTIEGRIMQLRKVVEELQDQRSEVLTRLVTLQRRLIERYGSDAEGLVKVPESLRDSLKEGK